MNRWCRWLADLGSHRGPVGEGVNDGLHVGHHRIQDWAGNTGIDEFGDLVSALLGGADRHQTMNEFVRDEVGGLAVVGFGRWPSDDLLHAFDQFGVSARCLHNVGLGAQVVRGQRLAGGDCFFGVGVR